MIRFRLAVVFALLAALALAQSVYAWWAATSAARHAERSVLASRMLAEYLEISADKQRLKVWFAERMLTGEAPASVRARLVAAMAASLAELRRLAAHPATDPTDAGEVETLARNIAVLEAALHDAERGPDQPAAATQWLDVIRAFDELQGRDMRELLRAAVERQERAIRREDAALAAALRRAGIVDGVLAIGVVVTGAFAVLYFLRRLDRPFAELARVTAALGRGDYGARSGLSGNDEFARIGRLLDGMAASLADARARSETLQRQLDELVTGRTRAAAVAWDHVLDFEAQRRRFFAELSHELRTPATVIRGEAELALRHCGDPAETAAALRRIVEAADELAARVRDLVDAARSDRVDYALEHARADLGAVVRAAVGQMQGLARYRGVSLEPVTVDPGPLAIEADPVRLQQALTVILDNAVRYTPAGGHVRVGVVQDAEWCTVHVDDDGPGMDESELERAFEPCFRGRAGRAQAGEGLGIGLGIAQRILAAHGGAVELSRRAGGGLRASLVLPRPSAAEAMA